MNSSHKGWITIAAQKRMLLFLLVWACAGGLVVFAFQNCSKAEFNTLPSNSTNAGLDIDGPSVDPDAPAPDDDDGSETADDDSSSDDDSASDDDDSSSDDNGEDDCDRDCEGEGCKSAPAQKTRVMSWELPNGQLPNRHHKGALFRVTTAIRLGTKGEILEIEIAFTRLAAKARSDRARSDANPHPKLDVHVQSQIASFAEAKSLTLSLFSGSEGQSQEIKVTAATAKEAIEAITHALASDLRSGSLLIKR